jgi:hypothetical protein
MDQLPEGYVERVWSPPRRCKEEDHTHRMPKHRKLYYHNKCGSNRIVDIEQHEKWHRQKAA